MENINFGRKNEARYLRGRKEIHKRKEDTDTWQEDKNEVKDKIRKSYAGKEGGRGKGNEI